MRPETSRESTADSLITQKPTVNKRSFLRSWGSSFGRWERRRNASIRHCFVRPWADQLVWKCKETTYLVTAPVTRRPATRSIGSDTTDNTAAAVVLISPMAFTRHRPDKPGMTHNPQVDRRRPGCDWHSQCRLCMLPFMQVEQDASMRWRVII